MIPARRLWMNNRPDHEYGHEYHCRFKTDNAIITDTAALNILHHKSKEEEESAVIFFFEIRTKFIVKTRLDDEVIVGSETFDGFITEDEGPKAVGGPHVCLRFVDYCMTLDDHMRLASRAFDFAKHCAAADPLLRPVVPVVVDLDVCTVQLDSECFSEVFERAIRPERLTPLYLWPSMRSVRFKEVTDRIHEKLVSLLLKLERTRVQNVDDEGFLSLMESCSVCLQGPVIGDMVSVLPCRHAFHSHCVVRWFIKANSCPLCRFKVHDFPVCKNLVIV